MDPTAAVAILVLTIVMPPEQPDIRRTMNMPSIQECWDNAHAFVAAGVPDVLRVRGAQAVMGACLVGKGTGL